MKIVSQREPLVICSPARFYCLHRRSCYGLIRFLSLCLLSTKLIRSDQLFSALLLRCCVDRYRVVHQRLVGVCLIPGAVELDVGTIGMLMAGTREPG